MAWIFSSKNKKYEKKQTFGQLYKNATGYDDKRAALCKGYSSTVISAKSDIEVSFGVMETFADVKGLCQALQITETDMLKLLANKESRMEDILKFIYQNVKQRTLICSICITTHEGVPTSVPPVTIYGIREILKFYLGHHVIICTVLKQNLYLFDHEIKLVQKILKNEKCSVPEYFLTDAVALLDYDHIYQDTVLELLKCISDHEFTNAALSLFVKLPYTEKDYSYINTGETLEVILKIKSLIYLMDNMFNFDKEFNNADVLLTNNLRKSHVTERINSYVRELEVAKIENFPPMMLFKLYKECHYYNICYFSYLISSNSAPYHETSLKHSTEMLFNVLKDIPYKRHEDMWFIEVNDENSNTIKNTYLQEKWCILVTNNTKDMVKEIYNDKIIWLLSEETQWKTALEPVLIFNGKDEFLLGTVYPSRLVGNSKENGNIYLSSCKCEKGMPRAWVCNVCKVLLQQLKGKDVRCNCGIQLRFDKKCFRCQFIGNTVFNDQNNTNPESSAIIETTIKPVEKRKANILFIGQSGAGKSMLVNSIYNYLTYDFENVAKAESVDCILPCQFQLQTPDFKKIVFGAGPKDENEYFNDKGQSVTQSPKVYSLKTEKYDYKVVDTPGLGDTRGAAQDQRNLELIRNMIINIEELHGICFVMPSNISKLTTNFEVHMRDLLSLFPKTALKNVFFFFTYANSTFFTIGDTRNSLEEFINTFKNTNNAEIPFGPENVCCVDSEAFMYFIATKQGHQYQNRDLESFRISWDKSKEAIENFLIKLENMEPIKSDDIVMTYELEQIGILLQKEDNTRLEGLISGILNMITQISMTSKFNSAKKANVRTTNTAFKRPELFHALDLCQPYIKNPDLKQLIKKLVECYGQADLKQAREKLDRQISGEYKSQGNENGIKVVLSQKENEQRNGSHPISLKKIQSNWPSCERLKKIAEKLGKEWENEKISRNEIENVLNVLIAANQKLEEINKPKLELSLHMLLKKSDVKGELFKDIENLWKEYQQF
jgi:hypothetical protein